MNGENYQLCSLVTSAKNALQKREKFNYEAIEYEQKIEFHFTKNHHDLVAHTPKEWFEQCVKFGLKDIKCLMPLSAKERALLGFVNVNRGCIVCYYKKFLKQQVTAFSANWTFDDEKKSWIITYQETDWENPPEEKPHFSNNSKELCDILKKIGGLAVDIEMPYWKENCFDPALHFLDPSFPLDSKERKTQFLRLPEENLRMFEAASMADVFGAMGSWNDSPPFAAHEKGLDQEYDAYSDELLLQIRQASLYAVNEW